MNRLIVTLSIIALILIGVIAYLSVRPKGQSGGNPSPSPSSIAVTTSPSATTTQAPTAQIIFPKGGESLVKGQKYALQWSGGPNPTQIFLINTALESQGQSVSIVDRAYNITNTGSYEYTIPATIDPGSYKFEIGNVTSNAFTVIAASSNQQAMACKPADLQASVATEGAAGSIYGKLTIKNISTTNCLVIGNAFVQATSSASNISITSQGQAGPATILLTPNQSVYSQVRYQNGPQCSNGTQSSTITFSYKISGVDSITFKDANGKTQLTATTCKAANELTRIEVWSLATTPIG